MRILGFAVALFVALAVVACAQENEPSYYKGLTPDEKAQLKTTARQTAREMKQLMSDFRTFYDELKGAMEEEGLLDMEDEDLAFGRTDILDEEGMMVVKMDMPGISKDRVFVRLHNSDTLEIEANRDAQREIKESRADAQIYQSERHKGHFKRTLQLPHRAAGEGFEAKLEDGVLTVRIPKEKSESSDVQDVPVL